MTIVNEWDTPYFCGYAASPWWRVDGVDDGIMICGLGWNPLLIDYGAVPEHDTSLIDARGLDGDYDMRTIGHLKTIYAVTDTDEIYTASWSSAEYMAQPERRQISESWERARRSGPRIMDHTSTGCTGTHYFFPFGFTPDRLAINGTKPKKGPCGPF